MEKFYIATERIYEDGYGPNCSPADGHKYYEDKAGVRKVMEGEFPFDWFIHPNYDKIIIETLSSRTIFVCELIVEKKSRFSIILDNAEALIDNLIGVQRIEGSDLFVINQGEKNSIITFLQDGSYRFEETPFYQIFKLNNNLSDEFKSSLGEHIVFVGIVKQKTNYSFSPFSYMYLFLNGALVQNQNISFISSQKRYVPIGYEHEYENGFVLRFNSPKQDKELKFLFIPNRGIVNKNISIEIECLGRCNLYKIKSLDNKWDVIDAYGGVYLSGLDEVGAFDGDYAENLIFCIDGKYGAMNRSGETLNIPIRGALALHKNSYGAKSGYIQRGCSILDVLGNSFEVSFHNHLADTKSNFKPIIDDKCSSYAIGGGLYCIINSSWIRNDDTSNYSYVVNRRGDLIKEKKKVVTINFLMGYMCSLQMMGFTMSSIRMMM